MASPAPRIGLFGTFDLENLGDMLLPRITERELLARLPDASIRFFGPLGYAGLNRFDDGREVEPFGVWSWERCSELATQLDVVLIGGGEIIHEHDELLAPHYGLTPDELRERAPSRFFIDGLGSEAEREVPVLWNAVGIPEDIVPEEAARFRDAIAQRPYVAVREETSARRLRAAGVEGEIAVVPDPALLVGRLFDAELLARRLEYLKVIGVHPAEGSPLVVQGNRDLLPVAADLAGAVARVSESLGEAPVVALAAGPCHGDDAFAGTFAAAYEEMSGRRVYVPGPAAGLVDVVAILSGASGVLASSLHVNLIAFAFGRSSAVLAMDGRSKLSAFGESIGSEAVVARSFEEIPGAFAASAPDPDTLRGLEKRIDAHFDRVAEIALEAAWRRSGSGVPGMDVPVLSDPVRGEVEQLRAALEVRSRRLVDERLHLADDMQELRAEIARSAERLDAANERIADLEGRLKGTEQELADIRSTALWRRSQGLRRIYSRVFMPFKRRMQRGPGESE